MRLVITYSGRGRKYTRRAPRSVAICIALILSFKRPCSPLQPTARWGQTPLAFASGISFASQKVSTHTDRLIPTPHSSPSSEKSGYACVSSSHCSNTSTAASYFGQVQGWHAKEFGIKLAAGMKLCRLPAMLKGLRRIHGEAGRKVRRGFSPQMLRTAMWVHVFIQTMSIMQTSALPSHSLSKVVARRRVFQRGKIQSQQGHVQR